MKILKHKLLFNSFESKLVTVRNFYGVIRIFLIHLKSKLKNTQFKNNILKISL